MFLRKILGSKFEIGGELKTFTKRKNEKIVENVKEKILIENQPCLPLITPVSIHKLIFVSIPSYRDPNILKTVRELFFNAKYPEMIQVGVCEQNMPSDPTTRSLRSENVLTDSIDSSLAIGPCYARERIEKYLLPRSQAPFVLCIDAHTLFRKNWDDILVRNMQDAEKEKSSQKLLFTGYPPQYNTKIMTWRECAGNNGVFMKATRIIANGTPLFVYNHLSGKKVESQKFTSCIGLAAGFIFARRGMFETVPYVSHVPFLFMGEEFVMAARYYTHGYDLLACPEQVIQTTYNRGGRPSFFNKAHRQKRMMRIKSNRRIRWLLGMDKHFTIQDMEDSKFMEFNKLGSVRSIQDFEKFCGISKGIISLNARRGLSGNDTNKDIVLKLG